MSLTGTTFQVLTILAAILVSVAVLLFWNRIRGPRPVRLLGRIAMLAAGYGLSAIAVLVSINIAYGGLIASWGDLFDNLNAHSVGQQGGPGGGRFGHRGQFGPPGGGPFGTRHGGRPPGGGPVGGGRPSENPSEHP